MNFQPRIFLLFLSLATCVCTVSPVDASFIVKPGDFVRLYTTPGRVSNGGEFLYKRNSVNSNWTSSSLDSARTFCCEMTEFMSFDTTYKVASVGTKTVSTGKTLSVGVASLYRKWYDGMNDKQSSITINGATYNYQVDAQRGKDARALQIAIWTGMGFNTTSVLNGESTEIKTKANAWISYVNSMNLSSTEGSDLFGIRIMNLKTLSGGDAQDQLVAVPEPSSVCSLLFVATGAGAFVRRKRA
jgi:hypothetical protein